MAVEAHEHTVEVHFKSLITGEKTKFAMAVDSTLSAAWDEAYLKLDESRRDGDTLHCAGAEEGRSLENELNLTLKQAREQQICGEEAFRYEIKGPSGGADA